MCSAVSRMQFGEAMDQVINALRRVRKVRPDEPNNFGILTQDRFKDEVAGITSKVQLGATAVACVGLMVGVIGVMNIMLVAVTQRTREIGIRKAVGARKHNIMFQFLVEAATLTMIGRPHRYHLRSRPGLAGYHDTGMEVLLLAGLGNDRLDSFGWNRNCLGHLPGLARRPHRPHRGAAL